MFCRNCGQKLDEAFGWVCTRCRINANKLSGQNEQAAVKDSAPQNHDPQQYVMQNNVLQYSAPQPQSNAPQQHASQNNTPQQYTTQNSTPQKTVKQPRKKRKFGCLSILLGLICAISVFAISAYLFIPGAFRPYDLGIKTSNEAYESAVRKLGYTKDQSPQQGTREDYQYVYGSPITAEISLNSEEITSFLNINRPPYYAVKNVQVRINSDNTVEAVASLDVSYVLDYMLEGQYSKGDAQRALPILGLIPNTINIYSKFSGGIQNNRVESMDIEKVSVMGIPIPQTLINGSEAKSFVKDTIDNNIAKETNKQNSSFDLLEVKNGKIVFKGQIPSAISRIPVR